MGIVSVSTGLAALLNAPGITTQTEACAAFIAAMGSDRRVIALRNGVPFRDCALSGVMRSENGSITGFGVASMSTVSNAANLATEICVLRITGGGHALEGTLGLPGSGATFIMQANPTATNGLAVSGVAIPLRQDLPLGIVITPPAPVNPQGVGVPYRAMLVDWSSGSAGEAKSVYFDAPQPDIIREDPDRFAEVGPIPYFQSSQTIVHGTGGYAVEIGFHLTILPAQCNDEVNAPVYEILPLMKPYGRWASYPFMDTYVVGYDSTFPRAYKIHYYDQQGNEVGRVEHRDNLPANSQQLKQGRTLTDAFEPFMHIKQAPYWCSHRLKLSVNARKWLNGMVPGSSNRPKQARQKSSVNASIPGLDGVGHDRNQVNALLHWFFMSADPLNSSTIPPITDPNAIAGLVANDSGIPSKNGYFAAGYQATNRPGAIAAHDWYTPPGGNRFDRYPFPSQLTAFLTEPNGTRPQGNVPYKTLCNEYMKGYFNLAHHDVVNVKTGAGIPFNEISATSYTYGYYTTQGPIFVPGGAARHINWFTTGNGTNYTDTPNFIDRDGLLPYHGSEIDIQHAYAHPFWYALMFNSAAAEMSARYRYGSIYWSGSGSSPQIGWYDNVMRRAHAWRWENQIGMWKIASNHSYSRAQLDSRFVPELEHFHDTIVVPATDPTHPDYNSVHNTCLRNFGMPGRDITSGGNHFAYQADDAKLFYLGGVYAIMKSMGALAYYRAKSVKCQKSLDAVYNWLYIYTVKQFAATKGRKLGWDGSNGAPGGYFSPIVPVGQPLVPYTGWQQWADTLAPVNGQADMVTNPDGTVFNKEKQQYQHIWMQSLFAFRDFHGDTSTEVVQACNEAQAMLNKFAAAVAAGTVEDFTYMHPAAGVLKAPAV